MYNKRMEKEIIGLIVLILILAALAFTDMKFHVIPNYYVISVGVIGVLLRLSSGEINCIQMLFDSVVVSMVMVLATLMFKGAFGGGDIKLMMASGILLGYRKNIDAFIFAMILAIFVGGIQICRKKKNLKDNIPLGPMISIGIVLCYINRFL